LYLKYKRPTGHLYFKYKMGLARAEATFGSPGKSPEFCP
jgi:hypothetical protein